METLLGMLVGLFHLMTLSAVKIIWCQWHVWNVEDSWSETGRWQPEWSERNMPSVIFCTTILTWTGMVEWYIV